MTYVLRAVKYFCACCLLAAAVVAGLMICGQSRFGFDDMPALAEHVGMMLACFAAVAALYPKIGFTRRKVAGDLSDEGRATLLHAFAEAGFEPVGEAEGVLRFRAKSFARRLRTFFDDEIRVTQEGAWLVLDGHRTEVLRVLHRWDAYASCNEK